MLKTRLEQELKKAVKNLGFQIPDIVLYIPKNNDFGDYTTNIPLQFAKQDKRKNYQSAKEIAKAIIEKLGQPDYLQKTEIAGEGFINFFLINEALLQNLHQVCDYSYLVNPEVERENGTRRKILVEYGQTNTLKAFHIGHLFNLVLGDSIARIIEAAGNRVFKVNYQGDIGLHVAKALWALKDKKPTTKDLPVYEIGDYLGQAYAKGAMAYDTSEMSKVEINEINTKLYLHSDSKLEKLWLKTRQMSLDYYQWVYKTLGVKYDKLFFESEIADKGKKIVLDNVNKVFKEDQGAIIFAGSEYGLHNRVFITSAGNPTYEAKEMAVGEAEYEAFKFDKAIHVVDSQQSAYFDVAFKALELIDEKFKGKQVHVANGYVGLKQGKMSSRTGDVVTFNWLYDEIKKRILKYIDSSNISKEISQEERQQICETVGIGAIKFAMLKYSPQTNIIFDLDKSVTLDGDSGPYVQYTYARAKSVLRNASYNYLPGVQVRELEKEERLLLQKLEHFEIYLEEAASKYHPNIITAYLLDLSKMFNLFYQKYPIIKAEEKAEFRLALTCGVAVVLKQGLNLLGIDAPERM